MAKSYDITEQQAILFSICMEKGSWQVGYDDLARHYNIDAILHGTDGNALGCLFWVFIGFVLLIGILL